MCVYGPCFKVPMFLPYAQSSWDKVQIHQDSERIKDNYLLKMYYLLYLIFVLLSNWFWCLPHLHFLIYLILNHAARQISHMNNKELVHIIMSGTSTSKAQSSSIDLMLEYSNQCEKLAALKAVPLRLNIDLLLHAASVHFKVLMEHIELNGKQEIAWKAALLTNRFCLEGNYRAALAFSLAVDSRHLDFILRVWF